MATREQRESERHNAVEAQIAKDTQPRVAADPEAEDDSSPKSETSGSLLYLGFGIPFVLFLSTGVFGVTNGLPVFAAIGFGVAAVLVVIAVILVTKLVRANRGRSHH